MSHPSIFIHHPCILGEVTQWYWQLSKRYSHTYSDKLPLCLTLWSSLDAQSKLSTRIQRSENLSIGHLQIRLDSFWHCRRHSGVGVDLPSTQQIQVKPAGKAGSWTEKSEQRSGRESFQILDQHKAIEQVAMIREIVWQFLKAEVYRSAKAGRRYPRLRL